MISSSTDVLTDCHPTCGCVEIYLTRACTGRPAKHWCRTSYIDPEVYDGEIFSVRFFSGRSVRALGFRLLFSFHQVLEQPVQVEEMQWDCAEPGSSLILQHTMCSPHSCAGEEDKAVNTCPSDLCGPSVVSVGETCCRVILPPDWFDLDRAQDVCSHYDSQVFTPISPQKWSSFVTWARAKGELYGNRYIPVWLKLSVHSLPAP